MALKPILTSGVALAGAAAIIAATPEIMPAPTVEVAAAQSVPTPTKISTAKYELTALSLRNALNALFEGYNGDDSVGEALGYDDVEPYGVDVDGWDDILEDDPDTAYDESADNWDPRVGFGVEALLYYLIDEGLASLGVNFQLDDYLFSAGQTALFYKIATDLGLDGLLAFISNPLSALPPEVGDLLTDPVGLVEGTPLEPILRIFHDPINADPTGILALVAALPTIIGETPILDVFKDPTEFLGPELTQVLTHPLGTLVAIIGALIPNDEDLVESEAVSVQRTAAVEDEGIADEGTTEEEGAAAPEEQKPSPFAAIKLPTPIEFRDHLTEKAKDALGAITPPAPAAEKVEEGTDEKTEAAPETKPGLPSLSETISDAKAKAKEAKAQRAEKRAERKENVRAALGLKPRTGGADAGATVGGGDDNGGGGGTTGGGTEGGGES
ncbi:hypothetical protein [Mycobacterium sp. ACS4331]|uniref:hypothetical protein n=1 Tax=Mycobacterium sp. ACS4331 TaxID=1834121 RepID=UPI000A9D72A8|nr:hypothetical protein [Mycobacterium sp. ACS4331]